MTEEELAAFCGVKPDDPLRDKFVRSLSPAKRALFERMATVEMEVELWQAGLGPKPTGVLIDTERDTKRRRAWR
jgi:hypothetical protein